MAQPPSIKALGVIRNLTEKLQQRYAVSFTLNNYVSVLDANSNPGVQVGVASGSWTTGNNYAVVVAQAVLPVFTDAIGNTLQGFAPTFLDISLESSATTNVPVEPLPFLGPLLDEAARQGAIVRMFLTANGVQPTTSSNTAGNLVLTMSPESQWQLAAS
jgi:hypothetical protein